MRTILLCSLASLALTTVACTDAATDSPPGSEPATTGPAVETYLLPAEFAASTGVAWLETDGASTLVAFADDGRQIAAHAPRPEVASLTSPWIDCMFDAHLVIGLEWRDALSLCENEPV